jgi:hypothetical protein
MTQLEDKLFALVRAAMTDQTFDAPLTDDDWRWLYRAAARQPEDIDIWVEGGKKSVVALIMELGLATELASTSVEGKLLITHRTAVRELCDEMVRL